MITAILTALLVLAWVCREPDDPPDEDRDDPDPEEVPTCEIQ